MKPEDCAQISFFRYSHREKRSSDQLLHIQRFIYASFFLQIEDVLTTEEMGTWKSFSGKEGESVWNILSKSIWKVVACNVIIAIHSIYSCPISMLMGATVKFICQNGAMHAVNVGRQDINKSA